MDQRYGGPERSNVLELKKTPANRKILQKQTKHKRNRKKQRSDDEKHEGWRH